MVYGLEVTQTWSPKWRKEGEQEFWVGTIVLPSGREFIIVDREDKTIVQSLGSKPEDDVALSVQ
jgi:hypothetical protein